MLKQVATSIQSNNFNLKNELVDLVRSGSSERVHVALEALEATRTQRQAVPASKHGLETICGASCETGAQ